MPNGSFFISYKMFSGNKTFFSPEGKSERGHLGNGFFRINPIDSSTCEMHKTLNNTIFFFIFINRYNNNKKIKIKSQLNIKFDYYRVNLKQICLSVSNLELNPLLEHLLTSALIEMHSTFYKIDSYSIEDKESRRLFQENITLLTIWSKMLNFRTKQNQHLPENSLMPVLRMICAEL